VEPAGARTYRIIIDDKAIDARAVSIDADQVTLILDGHRRAFLYYRHDDRLWLHAADREWIVDLLPLWPEPQPPADAGGSLRAPMPGSVTAVLVQAGDPVEKGQPLLILEAMKMEHTIRSAAAGVVETVYFAAGDTVEADARLVAIRVD
jgi:acetyl/propionyl-CoA carboxylase alpha subunit